MKLVLCVVGRANLFIPIHQMLREAFALPFVISTGAKRSGEICSLLEQQKMLRVPHTSLPLACVGNAVRLSLASGRDDKRGERMPPSTAATALTE